MNQIGFAFLMTTLAGLATGIGSAIAFFIPNKQQKYLSVALGFSAGVMIFISFSDLLPVSRNLLIQAQVKYVEWIILFSFFAGIFLIAGIEHFISDWGDFHFHNFLQTKIKTEHFSERKSNHLWQTGIMTAVALALHNFPEGMATLMAGIQSASLVYPIAFAVALHNIPEGIAISVPVFYATGSRKKAFFYSFLSGLTEPFGAIIGYLFLRPFLTHTLLSIIFSIVAGIMVYISFDELLPTAHKYGQRRHATIGLLIGIFLMIIFNILFD